MSHFRTAIPIDLENVKALLPKGATVEKVTYEHEKRELSMVWHHQMLETGYTFPVEFPVENLKAQKLPNQVRERVKAPTPDLVLPPFGQRVSVEAQEQQESNLENLGPKRPKKHTKKSSVST